jgi:hypothetical protein
MFVLVLNIGVKISNFIIRIKIQIYGIRFVTKTLLKMF